MERAIKRLTAVAGGRSPIPASIKLDLDEPGEPKQEDAAQTHGTLKRASDLECADEQRNLLHPAKDGVGPSSMEQIDYDWRERADKEPIS
jgi:hypothetical protein